MDFLKFALPEIGEEEIAEVTEVLRSGWLTTGAQCRRFEEEFAAAVGVKYALAVCSGTAALHLALEAAGVGPGDRVVTTPYTFTATAEVVRYLGADPIFADISDDTITISPSAVRAALVENERAKAVIPVHFGGLACDMNELVDAARAGGAVIVEDAAHALPTTYRGRTVGSIGEFTAFSFYVTKTITTGEGGMVTTDDPAAAERMRTMRLHGINRDVFARYSSRSPSWYYEVVAPGYKYNMTDIGAALGIHQLRKAERLRQRRERIARRYNERFAGLPVRLPPGAREGDVHAWHLYVLRLELERLAIDRDRFIELLAEAGIGASVHFIPLHLHPYWRDRYGFKPQDFPVSLDVYRRAVSLPIYPGMSEADVERVADTVNRILTAHLR